MHSVQEMLSMYQPQPTIVLQAPPPNHKAANQHTYDVDTISQLNN